MLKTVKHKDIWLKDKNDWGVRAAHVPKARHQIFINFITVVICILNSDRKHY